MKGKEEEGQSGDVLGEDVSLGSNLNRKYSPKLYVPQTGPTPTMMAAPLLTRSARKLHRRSLSQRATKPTKGLERGLTKSLQRKEKHKRVVLRLTGEEEEKEDEAPRSGLHMALN